MSNDYNEHGTAASMERQCLGKANLKIPQTLKIPYQTLQISQTLYRLIYIIFLIILIYHKMILRCNVVDSMCDSLFKNNNVNRNLQAQHSLSYQKAVKHLFVIFFNQIRLAGKQQSERLMMSKPLDIYLR